MIPFINKKREADLFTLNSVFTASLCSCSEEHSIYSYILYFYVIYLHYIIRFQYKFPVQIFFNIKFIFFIII